MFAKEIVKKFHTIFHPVIRD